MRQEQQLQQAAAAVAVSFNKHIVSSYGGNVIYDFKAILFFRQI